MKKIEDFDEDVDIRGFCAHTLSDNDLIDIIPYKNRIEKVLEKEDDDDIVYYLTGVKLK